jgi:hypothetical protein
MITDFPPEILFSKDIEKIVNYWKMKELKRKLLNSNQGNILTLYADMKELEIFIKRNFVFSSVDKPYSLSSILYKSSSSLLFRSVSSSSLSKNKKLSSSSSSTLLKISSSFPVFLLDVYKMWSIADVFISYLFIIY